MSKHATPPEGTIWYRGQRVLRSIVGTIIAGLLTIATGILAVNALMPQILPELAKFLPPEVIAWIAGAIGFAAIVSGAVSAIFSNPKVDAALKHIGLGSAPRSAATD